MSALPHIGQTVRNRRDLRVLRGAEAYAEHQHYTDESLRWEMERAARTELLPVQPEPSPFEPSPFSLAAMRAEFGPSWRAWALAYLMLCLIGAAGALLALGVVS